MFKRILQRWLGIRNLTSYVILTRKELGLPIATPVKNEQPATPEEPVVVKGYGH